MKLANNSSVLHPIPQIILSRIFIHFLTKKLKPAESKTSALTKWNKIENKQWIDCIKLDWKQIISLI